MTVRELADAGPFSAAALPDGGREIDGVYIGDLLSWVMGRARADNAWITIMSNINVVAVASLSDTACVILAEGVTLPDVVTAAAAEKGVNILLSGQPAYETALRLRELLG